MLKGAQCIDGANCAHYWSLAKCPSPPSLFGAQLWGMSTFEVSMKSHSLLCLLSTYCVPRSLLGQDSNKNKMGARLAEAPGPMGAGGAMSEQAPAGKCPGHQARTLCRQLPPGALAEGSRETHSISSHSLGQSQDSRPGLSQAGPPSCLMQNGAQRRREASLLTGG